MTDYKIEVAPNNTVRLASGTTMDSGLKHDGNNQVPLINDFSERISTHGTPYVERGATEERARKFAGQPGVTITPALPGTKGSNAPYAPKPAEPPKE